MSRLYLRLQDALAAEAITPAGLRRVLQDCIDSQGGLSTSARIVLRFEQLLRRQALASDNAGWKRYPVEIDATLAGGHLALTLVGSEEHTSELQSLMRVSSAVFCLKKKTHELNNQLHNHHHYYTNK